jgi:hypothetical protein
VTIWFTKIKNEFYKQFLWLFVDNIFGQFLQLFKDLEINIKFWRFLIRLWIVRLADIQTDVQASRLAYRRTDRHKGSHARIEAGRCT